MTDLIIGGLGTISSGDWLSQSEDMIPASLIGQDATTRGTYWRVSDLTFLSNDGKSKNYTFHTYSGSKENGRFIVKKIGLIVKIYKIQSHRNVQHRLKSPQ